MVVTVTRYIMYKNKINNIGDNRFPNIASNINQNHLWLKRGWHKDSKSWLNHWGVEEEVTLQTIDNIKDIFTSKMQI